MKQFSRLTWIFIWGGATLLVPLAFFILDSVFGGIRASIWAILIVAICPLFLIAAIFTIAWRADMHDRNCAEKGICPKCGYNRAGLDPTARCPECGKS